MNRRLFVGAVAAGGLGAAAGCLDDLEAYLEDRVEAVTTFEASPAVVDEDAADDAGYDYEGTAETVREAEVGGQSVEATNYFSEYVRTIDVPLDIFDGESEVEAGVFGVVTTPQASVADEDFNPVGDMSHAEIVERVQNQYEELEIEDESRRRRTVEALDQTLTLHTYEGEATFHEYDGIDVLVDVTQPDYGGDHFVIVAVYPDDQGLDHGEEEERIETMIEELEHGEDVDADIREEGTIDEPVDSSDSDDSDG